ncbi:hypothetical protein M0802_004452 [Mischocyttarus mexicanus]|nr:hypothetical protein M0802_004452 [Mischocyttarus mexicanus]
MDTCSYRYGYAAFDTRIKYNTSSYEMFDLNEMEEKFGQEFGFSFTCIGLLEFQEYLANEIFFSRSDMLPRAKKSKAD